jgi:hypothetical protein
MAFNPLSTLKSLLGTVVGNIPVIGGPIRDMILKIDTEVERMSPEQRLALDNAVRATELENFKLTLADSADMRKLAMAELEQPYIKFVRPGILVGLFLIIVFYLVGVPIIESFGHEIPSPDMNKLPEELWWLFGSAYLGYGTMREIGKKNKLNSKS